MKKSFAKKIQLPPKASVLDLGCFDGKANKWMVKEGYPYQGVDLLFENIYIRKADFIPWLELNKKKFDLVLAEFSLQQISRKKVPEVIQNIHKALKPQGYLFIRSFNDEDSVGPQFSQQEFLEMGTGLKLRHWNNRDGFDQKKRKRQVTDVLFQK